MTPALSGLSGIRQVGPGFSWGDYPGLVHRYDPSNLTNLVIANSLVSQATDLTGNGNHAVQANASLQPTTVELVSGKYALQGNAVAFLATTAAIDAAAKTVFAIVKAPEGNTVRHFSGAAQSRLGITAADARFIRAGTQLSCGAYTANTLELWLAEFNSTASNLYVNGGTPTGTGDAGNSTDATLTLLSLASGTQATDGALGDYVRFNRVLTTAEKNVIGNALATKWGLTWTAIS